MLFLSRVPRPFLLSLVHEPLAGMSAVVVVQFFCIVFLCGATGLLKNRFLETHVLRADIIGYAIKTYSKNISDRIPNRTFGKQNSQIFFKFCVDAARKKSTLLLKFGHKEHKSSAKITDFL